MVPEALVFIDGAAMGKVPQEKKLSAGEHPVVVRLEGFKQFEQKVRVEAGQTVTVQADLKAVGRLRILSTPSKAQVIINGLPAGKTPLDTEVEVGETVVRIESAGFQPFEQHDPGLRILVEELWAPATEIQRSAAHTICQSGELRGRVPWKSPHFLSRFIQAELALFPEVLDAGSASYVQSGKNGQVLHVLRNGEWTSFQNKNAVTASRVLGEEMLCADSAERPTADDNHEFRRTSRCWV
jgi:hypothetical protein